MWRYFLALAVMFSAAQAASADVIEQACLQSSRSAANPQVCGCVQDVANLTLGAADQKRAAKFFADPQQAQNVRQSDSQREREFWKRYRLFADSAATYCS